MKICLITDTHWGARGDHLGFIEYFEKFYDDVFFPTLESRKIDKIIHLGDLVDRRKFINFFTASRLRVCFLERLAKYDVHVLLGNHDCFYKNTNSINALNELLAPYKNIKIWTDPGILSLSDSHKLLMLPWINSSNEEDSMEYVRNSRVDYCFGHLQLINFEMQLGSYAHDGLDASLFNRFTGVYSGHFHHKSTKNNIHYLGAPYEMNWADYGDPRGFHILDLDTGELEFIENPHKLFHKIIYNDSNISFDDLMKDDFSRFHKKYIKVIIVKKDNSYWFEQFIDELEKAGPFDLQIIENSLILNEDDPELIEKSQDTLTLLKDHINSSSMKVDKVALSNLLSELYNEATLIKAAE